MLASMAGVARYAPVDRGPFATIRSHLTGRGQRSLREIPSFFIIAFKVVRKNTRRVAAVLKQITNLWENTQDLIHLHFI
jgi:hypothetical protein